MTNTITKRADELKPGDILPANEAWVRRVIVSVKPLSRAGDGWLAIRWAGQDSGALETLDFAPSSTFEVESTALSSAQQHAEELLALVRKTAESTPRAYREEMDALLAKIDPPAPPTLEEALYLLKKARSRLQCDPGFGPQDIDAILDRARRSDIKF